MSQGLLEERPSTRRKWAAIGASTLLLAGSFWAVHLSFWEWLGDLTQAELEAGVKVPLTTGVVLGLMGGFALMAAGFVTLALVSRRRLPLRSASFASLVGVMVWLLAAYLAGEPWTPLVAGFSAGGVVALRAEPEHTVGRRVLAAALITAYMFLLLRLTPLVGIIVAPLLPLPTLAWADALAERRAANRPVGDDGPPKGRPRRR